VQPPKIIFALPGLHEVQRGAEVALESIASGLAESGEFEVLVYGGGPPIDGRPYKYHQLKLTRREKFERTPKFPPLRNEVRWEEMTFSLSLRKALRTQTADLTLTCSYPFINWVLRGARGRNGGKAQHIFVTENGDYPALRVNHEYKLFKCAGLVCTNPEFYNRNKDVWPSTLIPNGVDLEKFRPGPSQRKELGLPADGKLVVMASALIKSKRVAEAICAVAELERVSLAVAGDGPLREEVDSLAKQLLGSRYARVRLQGNQMPSYYCSGDAFLHMSREESFGNVYIEALACGLPVIAHDYPTARWILGEQAQLVDTELNSKTTEAIRTAIEGPRPDPQELHNTAAARFSWSVITSAYAEFLKELIGRSRETEN